MLAMEVEEGVDIKGRALPIIDLDARLVESPRAQALDDDRVPLRRIEVQADLRQHPTRGLEDQGAGRGLGDLEGDLGGSGPYETDLGKCAQSQLGDLLDRSLLRAVHRGKLRQRDEQGAYHA